MTVTDGWSPADETAFRTWWSQEFPPELPRTNCEPASTWAVLPRTVVSSFPDITAITDGDAAITEHAPQHRPPFLQEPSTLEDPTHPGHQSAAEQTSRPRSTAPHEGMPIVDKESEAGERDASKEDPQPGSQVDLSHTLQVSNSERESPHNSPEPSVVREVVSVNATRTGKAPRLADRRARQRRGEAVSAAKACERCGPIQSTNVLMLLGTPFCAVCQQEISDQNPR